jgi:hypothetical protein
MKNGQNFRAKAAAGFYFNWHAMKKVKRNVEMEAA